MLTPYLKYGGKAIELIWAAMKPYIARNNKSLKMDELKDGLISPLTPDLGKNRPPCY